MKNNYPDKIWLIVANPLTAITETFKYGFTGVGVFEWSYLLYSLAFAVVILLLGIVRAEDEAPYKTIIQLMDKMKGAGVTRFGLATDTGESK